MTPSSVPPVIEAERHEPEDAATLDAAATATGDASHEPAAPSSAAQPISRMEVVSRATATSPWWRHPLAALGLVLAGIVVFSLLARRFVPAVRAAHSGALRVLTRTHLSSRQSVVLLQAGRKLLLIGVTPERIAPLCVLDDPEENAEIFAAIDGPASERGRRFLTELQSQRDRFGDAPHAPAPPGDDPALPGAAGLDGSRRELQRLLDALRARKAG